MYAHCPLQVVSTLAPVEGGGRGLIAPFDTPPEDSRRLWVSFGLHCLSDDVAARPHHGSRYSSKGIGPARFDLPTNCSSEYSAGMHVVCLIVGGDITILIAVFAECHMID